MAILIATIMGVEMSTDAFRGRANACGGKMFDCGKGGGL